MIVDADTIKDMRGTLQSALNLIPATRQVRVMDYTLALEYRPKLGVVPAADPIPQVVIIRFGAKHAEFAWTADGAWIKQAVAFIQGQIRN